jgi:hypothetical protein
MPESAGKSILSDISSKSKSIIKYQMITRNCNSFRLESIKFDNPETEIWLFCSGNITICQEKKGMISNLIGVRTMNRMS